MFRSFGSVSNNHAAPYRAPVIAPPRYYEGPGYPTQDRRIPIPHRAYLAPVIPEYTEVTPEETLFVEQPLDFLPVDARREDIISAVKANPITILVADTGAGKSTRVPGYLFEAGFDRVYETQPRRAAARNVYNRIAEETTNRFGDNAGSRLVSFQTGGEYEGPEDAKIRIITDGLQLVKEYDNKGTGEGEVLIIDELHEWNLNVSFLSAWVKKIIADKPDLRVVLMSATVNAEEVAEYFADVVPDIPPILRVEGRTFPIKSIEEPQSTLSKEVVKYAQILHAATPANKKGRRKKQLAAEQNGILAFVPGKRELQDAIDEIKARLPKELADKTVVIPLHAKLSPQEQQKAFEKVDGIKIVVSTDVAQTSLTIPDIGVVIDCGLNRRMELDRERVQGLVIGDISKADCDQRKGRTGRVAPGTYVLTRLSSHEKFVSYASRKDYPKPEILRTDLSRNVLRLAGVGLDLAELDMFHKVEKAGIEKSKASLRMIGALAVDGTITTVGKRMNELPVHASLGRMLVEAGQHGKTVQTYMAAIAAAREVGGLQYYAQDVGTEWENLTEDNVSDLLVQLDLFIAAQSMTTSQIRGYDLDVHNIERSQELFRKLTKRLKLSPNYNDLLPPTFDEREILRKCFYAGLVDYIYRHEGGGKYRRMGDEPGEPREISNRSKVTGHPEFVVGYPYYVVTPKKGEEAPVIRHILEQVTSARMCDLGSVATGLTQWRPQGYGWRNNQIVSLERQFLGKIDMGVVRETAVEPSPRLRAEIIHMALEKPGKQQRILHDIKDELERLSHLSKDPLKRLTQDKIRDYVEDAAPDDITHPSMIENNLRKFYEETGLSLDSFVDPLQRKRIERNAPPKIRIGDVTLRLSYRNGKVLVKSWRVNDLMKLKEEVFLRDGRHVLFLDRYKQSPKDRPKPRNLTEMQGILSEVVA